ncbi:hypothetical protein [Roseibium sp. RKSG952]|uniref:hypothetical protein n=1 Tax=Roseibium sp. RKSG952 TaxID=2529384 RepID=UPI0012BCD81A|nr:hypothetical protein [Roseibium sp. RKSG952]MTI02432.1 hypothetical protein [Roseibium sp. RKSG952]
MFLRFLFVLSLVLPNASSLQAEEDIVVQLGTRTFYAGEDYWGRESEDKFLPLNRLDWLNEILKESPILDRTVIHIDQLNRDSDFLWSPTGPGGWYTNSEAVPERFRLPGYTVNTGEGGGFGLMYLTPNSSEKQYALGCSAEIESETYEFCGLRARYPLDPRIIVKTRIYHPPPMDQLDAYFEKVAELTVSIALCLDITDQLKQDARQLVREYLVDENTAHCVEGLSS